MAQIVLASQSPRRKQLLEWAEIDFEIIVANTDETFPAELSPSEAAIHIARNKAQAVLSKAGRKPVLAADTIVVLDNQIIGKPRDRGDAMGILSRLSGREHKVITGITLIHQGQEITFADTTDVRFHLLTPEQIAFYVDKYKPYDKAGAYAIQEWIGVVGIQSINGDFYNVMGLPVSRVVQVLQQLQTI
jgi:septum formation protein